MLPDSNVNEPASHGFVKFTVSQQPGNPMGTVINNQAAIYFDFNDPIFTNIYSHTVGDDFVEMTGQSGDLSVSGHVTTWYGQPVDSAEMRLTNLCPVYSDADGYFLFENIDTAVYSLTGKKNSTHITEGVTVLDMIKLKDHILGANTLNTYQILAADLNHSNTVTTFDLVVFRKMILGMETNDQYRQWKFFRADYDPTAPILPSDPPANAYIYDPLDMNLDGQDFLAVQPGNVLDESMVEPASINTQFYFEPMPIENGQMRVNVKANEYTKVNAFQFGLKWDADILQYAASESVLLGASFDIGVYSPSPNQVSIAYIGNELTASADAVLFTLIFNVLGNTGDATPLSLDETNLPLQVVVDTCKLASPSVITTDITISEPNTVIEFEDTDLHITVAPNPVRQGGDIQLWVSSKKAEIINIQMFDLSGALIESSTLNVPLGQSFHRLMTPLPKGVYLLKVKDGKEAEMAGKIVVH